MQFIREKLSCSFGKKAESSIFGALESEFSPVVAGGRRELLKDLHLSSDSLLQDFSGDLFISPSGTLCFYRISPDHKAITAGAAWQEEAGRSCWDRFRSLLSSVSGSSSWQADPILSSRFVMLLEESELLNVGDWERKAACALQRPQLRHLVKVINSKVNISLQAASEGRPLKEVGAEVQEMEEMGVINREFQVLCRETHQMVTCVSSLAALDDASGRGLKCFHCGRSISEEQIVQTLGITAQGHRLAQPNMWLAIMVGAELIDLGIDPSRIVYRSEDNYKTVEVFADVLGSLFMFSVQEDGVTPDSAFRFLNRTHFFKPDFGYIVTPKAVSREAAAVIANGENLCISDNMADLGNLLKEAIDKSSKHVISELLEGFSNKTQLSMGDILGNYFFGPESIAEAEPVEEPAAQVILPVAQPEAVQPEAEQLETAHQEIAEPEAVPEEKMEEALPEINDAEPAVEHAYELELPAEDIKAADIAEEVQAESIEPASADNLEIADISIDSAEQIAESQEAVHAEQAAPEFSESICEPSVFAEMSDVISEIMAQIPEIFESNDTDNVAPLLDHFSSVEGASAMLADSEGFAFAGAMETCEDPESAAALQCDLVAGVSAKLIDAGLGVLKYVYICGRPGTIGVYAAEEGLNLMIHSQLEMQDELAARDAGGRKRSDAFRQALADIRALPGVTGALIAKCDGMINEADMPLDIDAIEHIAFAAGHILSESAADFAENMGYAPIVGIIVGTEEAAFSIIPLGMNFMLVTQMELDAPEQLWRVSIPDRAGIAFSVLG